MILKLMFMLTPLIFMAFALFVSMRRKRSRKGIYNISHGPSTHAGRSLGRRIHKAAEQRDEIPGVL